MNGSVRKDVSRDDPGTLAKYLLLENGHLGADVGVGCPVLEVVIHAQGMSLCFLQCTKVFG